MNEGVKNKDQHTINVLVESNCPLNWLAEYYQKYNGKAIEIDDTFVDFIKNASDKSRLVHRKNGSSVLYAFWEAGAGKEGIAFPSTKLKVEIHGTYQIGDGGNRNFITEIDAEDIPDFSFKASPDNTQIVFLKAEIQKDFQKDRQLSNLFTVKYHPEEEFTN